MTLKPWLALAAALALAAGLASRPAAVAQPAAAAAADAAALFDAHCKSCHEPPIERAPSRAALATRPRADIVTALTTGAMAPMATGLTRADIEALAAYLTNPQAAPSAAAPAAPPQAGAAPARPRRQPAATNPGVDRMCAQPGVIRPGPSDWTAQGFDPLSTRFQPHPGLTAADLPRLKVKWAFALAGGGQPTVIGDWLFTTNRGGKLYALDARTGCVRWAVDGVSSRTTPMIVRAKASPSGWATFIGAGEHKVRAFDAQSGKLLWTSEALETHPAATFTGSPIVAGDRLLVPISSYEEVAARVASYPCCSFRGSVVALDLATGKTLWKTSVITEPLAPTRKNAAGVQMQGPAGAAIWSAPTVDASRGLAYIATGDSYTDTPTKGDDAIVALDLKTGAIRWSTQVTQNDNFVMGCGGRASSPNCPTPVGPDFDFGASPVLISVGAGRQVLAAGQKSGLVYGLDPDTGRLLWTTRVGQGSPLGGVEWGLASDGHTLFAPNADTIPLIADAVAALGKGEKPATPANPGLSAIDPATGKIVWRTASPVAPCHYAGDRSSDYLPGFCNRAQSASPSVIPGVVFAGTLDGWLRAYDIRTGKILWAFSTTAQTYATANGVPDQPGGGLDGLGPTIAGGMVYAMSGFNGASNTGGNGVNVLLAFSVDGK